ncbi:MAG: hypothetical protein ACRDSE_14420 [Pseudonocardiaceae bacterium]
MAPITTTTEVDRPPEDVFAYVTDPTRFVNGSGMSSAGTWTPTARRLWARNA